MNISFEGFAYKKKPTIFQIEDSDSESSSVQCLEDLEKCNQTKNDLNGDTSLRKRKSITVDSDTDEEVTCQSAKRKRICVIDDDSDTEDHAVEPASDAVEIEDAEEEAQDVVQIEDEDEVEEVQSGTDSPGNQSLDETNQQELWNMKISSVLSFLESCSVDQLASIPGCTRKKAERIFSMGPFTAADKMIESISAIKSLDVDVFLENCMEYIDERTKFEKLLTECEQLSKSIEDQITEMKKDCDNLPVLKPLCVNEELELKSYQKIGLNWLAILHGKDLNGILADQMGLGKTIQTLAFVGYLLENGYSGPHVIVCPCSTFDNWIRELEKWLPDVSYVQYNGNQTERMHIRKDISEGYVDAQVIITTFNIILSTKMDRKFFRTLGIRYLILDEAHMIKNMKTERYKHLLQLQASRKLLLTGTPLQNDVMELMSLLTFLMPDMFTGYQDVIKMLFCRQNSDGVSSYEKELLPKVKKILKPFVLRRLKKDVLSDMPTKKEIVSLCTLTDYQRSLYKSVLAEFKKNEEDVKTGSGMALLTQLRKITNHPLLARKKYEDSCLREMANEYVRSPFNIDCDVHCVFEDMGVMSDFELHTLCSKESSLKKFKLSVEEICDCGKTKWLDENLPALHEKGDRILLFSQFVIMLDILEAYVKIRGYRFLRIDGSTAGCKRQELVDEFNTNPEIFVFLLSTKAGGLGINLTAANVVIFHDIDFNPYNDKQAEDRCHRLGQNRDVTVYKLIGKDTIEENMLKCGEKKLQLEKEVVGSNEQDTVVDTSKAVLSMLRKSL